MLGKKSKDRPYPFTIYQSINQLSWIKKVKCKKNKNHKTIRENTEEQLIMVWQMTF